MARTRIFVSVSHISCVYMTRYAQRTHLPGDLDILFVDTGIRRAEVVQLMLEAAGSHRWALIQDMSDPVSDDHRFQPSLRKRLVRRWKEMPMVRKIYAELLLRHMRKRDARYAVLLRTLLRPFDRACSEVELFAHTQSYLQRPLGRLFPLAPCAYFEHGLGDYHYIAEHGQLAGPFHALFATRFQRFLERRNIDAHGVRPLAVTDGFPELARELLLPHLRSLERDGVPAGKPLAFILLEAVDMYHVQDRFWGAYIDHILSVLDRPERYHFLLKPHPSATLSSLAATEERCRALGLSYTMLDAALHKSIAAEVLFAAFADRTEHVFCLFSSACFYLSELYREPNVAYHYSTAFMDRWTANAPPMYKRHFDALKPLIKEVFAERCLPY